MVPPLFLWDRKDPRRSEPDLRSDSELRMVCRFGGVFSTVVDGVGLLLDAAGSLSVDDRWCATEDDSVEDARW